MKKFLFTLVSLFMASSAFANSYFYMEKVEITEDMIGDEIELIVGADFQEYVSAFELWITMPEGLEIVDYEVGADMKGMKYYNQRGREQSLDASVTTLDMQHFVGITSAAATGYYQLEDESWAPYGAIKWEPGVYEEMIILYVEVSAIPTGDVTLRTEPGCGQDPRTDNLATPANGNDIPWGVVPGDTPEPQPAPAPTFREEGGKVYAECADHEVVLMIGDEVVPNPYTLPEPTFEDQVINFTAYTVANADESENSAPVNYTATVAKKDDAQAPAPTFRVEDGKLYAEQGDMEVVLMIGDEVVPNPYTLPTENTSYTDDIVIDFVAYTVADGENYNINSDNAEYTFTLPHLTKNTCESPSIMRNIISDTQCEIIITPDPATDGALEFTADPMPGAKTEILTYERKDADYTVAVRARTAEGPTYLASDWEEANIVIPAKPAPDVTPTPSVTYSYENGELTVWAYGSGDDAEYTLYCDGVEYTGAMPIEYDIYEGYGPHTWTATAIAPGKTVSDVSEDCEIVIEAEPKVYTTPDPVIGEPTVNDENVTVVVTGEGHIVVTVTMGTETLNFEGDGTVNVVIPRGEEDDFAIINAVATAPLPEGYDEVQPGRATSDLIDIPALPEQTAAPTITNKDGKSEWDTDGNLTYDGHYTTVTITNNDEEDVVIYWSYDGVTYQPYTGPWNITEDGDYVIYAYAQAEGRPASEVVSWAVHVTPATGVVELVNGKAVAGVRYFNMAGQEMKEANGVTIVVTTYTDGTTSAVKVIK